MRRPNSNRVALSILPKCFPPIKPIYSTPSGLFSIKGCSFLISFIIFSWLALKLSSCMNEDKGMFLALKYISRWAIRSAPSYTCLSLDAMSYMLYYSTLQAARCSFYCIFLLYPLPVYFLLYICFCKASRFSILLGRATSKQDCVRLWQKGLLPSSTTILRQSLSQSIYKPSIFWVLPDYSPFFISLFNFLEKRCN